MTKRIGESLVERGVLNQQQVEEILTLSGQRRLSFADAGIELGLISRENLVELLGPNYGIDSINVDVQYFPEVTKNFFATEFILKHGVIPLGFKKEPRLFRAAKKRLNVGVLNPNRTTSVHEIAAVAKARLGGEYGGVKIYLVLADQFLEVLQTIYGVDENQLRQKSPTLIDDNLQMYLTNA